MAAIKIEEPGQNEISDPISIETIIGIDFGTTNSLVGIVENNKTKIFADKNGQDIHPSIVCYDQEGRVLSVCYESDSVSSTKVASIKRLIGKDIFDFANHKFSFEIDSSAQLKLVIGSKKIRPEEVAAEILKHLKNIAEENLQKPVKKAVITVPAYFDEAAKQSIKIAASLIDLEVIRLLSEPTAAAFAYGLDKDSEGIYCVYDLGGGTFDVSILKMQKGVFKVMAVAGNNSLGGDDFDNLLMEKISKTESISDVFMLKKFARQIKEMLSMQDLASLKIGDKNFTISRQDFENLITEKLNETFSLTQNLIDDLDLEVDQIKGVIMVGGSTRIPAIKNKLSQIFGAEKILDQIDPDRIVASGAAWQAHNLSGANAGLLLDVTALSLGIEMMGGIVEKIIPRNTTIPVALAKEFTTYADNQTAMKLHIVQGERELAKDCRSLANFEIKNIPPMKAGMARILVSFKVDADGLLTVSAKEEITNQVQEVEIKPSYSLSQSEIKSMLLDSLKNSNADIQERLLIEAINESSQDVETIAKDLQKFSDLISVDEKKIISEKLQILRDEIAKRSDRDAIVNAHKMLEKAAEPIILLKVNSALDQNIAGKKIDEVI